MSGQHSENVSLTCLRSQIDFFPKGGPPRPALPFPFSSKRKIQRSSRAHPSDLGELTSARAPSKKACDHSPPLQIHLRGGGFPAGHVLHTQCVSQQTTAVITIIRAIFPLPISTSVSSLFPHSNLPPCHKVFGLESHSRHVKLDFKHHRMRIIASVRSQDASFLRCR